MKLAILGFGREGKSILKFLNKSPKYRDAEVEILDKNFDRNYLKNLQRFDLIFHSPGIPYNLPELKRVRKAGIKFSSATKLFFDEIGKMVRRGSPQIIGITGTKGKGTTATLLYEILKAAHKPVFLAGNIGTSPLDILPGLKKNSLVILELSSFQLQDLEKSPRVAAVVDVFPDHQDTHSSLREYYGAKTQIARHQLRGDKIFFFKNNAGSRWVASKSHGKKIAVDENKFRLFSQKELKIFGAHNFKNAVMAATIALNLGAAPKTILSVVKNFRGLEHRLEFVRKIGNVGFYNDSASTNPQTTAAAIRAFSDKQRATGNKRIGGLSRVTCSMSLVLIAGGQDKCLDYAPLASALRQSNTTAVILFGENKKKIARALRKREDYKIIFAANLKVAVKIAYRFAKNLPPTAYHQLATVILFSPGAASFDMFKNYADRGEQFKRLVKKIDKIKLKDYNIGSVD